MRGFKSAHKGHFADLNNSFFLNFLWTNTNLLQVVLDKHGQNIVQRDDVQHVGHHELVQQGLDIYVMHANLKRKMFVNRGKRKQSQQCL